jgi:hypothetical protein
MQPARMQRLVVAWEGQLHERLGYYPAGFRATVRASICEQLAELSERLHAELNAARAATEALRAVTPEKPEDFFLRAS